MKYLLICNKTDPFIRDLFQALNEKGFESSIFQINGFKLISQKESKNLNPKTLLNFLKNTPKLKVFWKILAIKDILDNLQFTHAILFFYNWTLKLPISFLKKDRKFSFYLDNPIKIDTNVLKKSQKIILTSNCDIESFKKLHKEDFSNKIISIPKIVDFESLTKIKESVKQNRIYCNIQDIDDIEKFIKKLENLEYYEFIFPLIGESFERREKIKSILKNSQINYKLFNNFLSLEENFRLILSSKSVIALSNPKYSNIIQLSLFANKTPLIFEKYLCFFSKNKFHFATINNTSEIVEKINIKNIKNENRFKSIEEFSKKAVVKKLTGALERG